MGDISTAGCRLATPEATPFHSPCRKLLTIVATGSELTHINISNPPLTFQRKVFFLSFFPYPKHSLLFQGCVVFVTVGARKVSAYFCVAGVFFVTLEQTFPYL